MSEPTKEDVYDAEISPLMTQIIAVCKRRKINMAAQFVLDPTEDDGPLYCTTVIDLDGEDAEGLKRVHALADVMKPPPPTLMAFTIRTA